MNPLLRTLLLPPSWLWLAAVSLRNRRYDRPENVLRAPVPVVSVGNLTVGGTGKTPLVAWVAQRLLALGRRPAIVSRGYGGSAGLGPVIVSRGDGPLCDASLAGDEPWWLASRLPGARVVVGSDRLGAAVAAASAGADVVVLDDGYQHRRLARDLDLVLLDSTDPFGGGRMLPAGRLREPIGALRRAHVVLITRSAPGQARPDIEREVRRHNPTARILLAGHRPIGFVDAAGHPATAPRRVLAFCGIADPRGFRLDLEREGLEVVGFRSFRDHHAYRPGELAAMRALAQRAEATLVTTEKDLARLGALRPNDTVRPVLAQRIEARVDDPETLLAELRRVAGRSAP